MPNKRITWFCVADAGTARIKQQNAVRGPLESITTLNHAPYEHGRYEEAGRLFERMTTGEYEEFLTLPAYDLID